MKSLFDWIRPEGHFRRADLAECAEPLVNPDRGWYQIFAFVPGEGIDWAQTRSCLCDGESLVLILLDIGRYARAPLPAEALDGIREILDFFAAAGKGILLRGVYDRNGRGMAQEPSLFSLVSTHLEQIAGIVAAYRAHILVYQGLLVGSWGEMHGSKYLGDTHLASLAALLEGHLRDTVCMAVRTPAQLARILRDSQVAGILAGIDRTGSGSVAQGRWTLFDDALLGSETDCGTFDGEPARREQELQFAEQITLHAPCGGEVIGSEGYPDTRTTEQILGHLRRLHVTYLNRQHDPAVLERWKGIRYTGKGAFAGRSLYDYIGAHLGYRFLVTEVQGRQHREAGVSRLSGRICVQNLGFAPIYCETVSTVEWADAEGRSGSVPVALHLAEYREQKRLETTFEIQSTCLLKAPVRCSLLTRRKDDGALIRFANRQTEDGSVLLGEWL